MLPMPIMNLACIDVFGPMMACTLRGVWFEELKFNKYCSTFVLFDKKFSILD
jgi:hypothetical protein